MKSTALNKHFRKKSHVKEVSLNVNDLTIRWALFAYGGVTNHTAEWLAETAYQAGRRGIDFRSISANSSACIGTNRSKSLGRWYYETKASCLLMLDRDMVPSTNMDLIDICATAVSVDAVVSVVASKKDFGKGIVGKVLDGSPAHVGIDDLQQASLAGTGIMAIPRTVIDRAQPKLATYCAEPRRDVDLNQFSEGIRKCADRGGGFYYDWFGTITAYQPDVGWLPLGEDISFCMRMRAAGEAVYVTDKYRIGHVGDYVFMPEDGLCKE